MTTTFQSECPLCRRSSTVRLLDYDHWRQHECECCGEFEVSRIFVDNPAFTRLADFPVDVREALAAQAKALPKGKQLRITLGYGERQKAGQMWMAVVVDAKGHYPVTFGTPTVVQGPPPEPEAKPAKKPKG